MVIFRLNSAYGSSGTFCNEMPSDAHAMVGDEGHKERHTARIGSTGRCRRPFHSQSSQQSGFTLVELVVSMTVTATLLAGLFLALTVSGQAMSPNVASNAIVDASGILADLTEELQLARAFSERTATTVAFTVADRDGDATDESIRYSWSGTPGDPLTRQYNNGPVREVLHEVTDFQLHYDIETVTDNGNTKYYVRSIRIVLQPTTNTQTRLYSAAFVFNSPEVETP